MTSSPELFFFASTMLALSRNADQYPPPEGLTYKWLDKFTVNVAWMKPRDLPDDGMINFILSGNTEDGLMQSTFSHRDKYTSMLSATKGLVSLWMQEPTCLKGNHRNVTLSQSFLTEEMHSDNWTYRIWTVRECKRLDDGKPAIIPVSTEKPRAELVKDFKCAVYSNEMRCSWIPVSQTPHLTLSYRICGSSKKSIESLRNCDRPYSTGERYGCNLSLSYSAEDVCILVETPAVMSTFKAPLVVPPPELTVAEDGDYLRASSTPPEIGNSDCWTYEVCYRLCNKPEVCQNTSSGEPTMKIPYNKNCLYEFRSKARMSVYCSRLPLFSDFSEAVFHGSNKLPDLMLTVVSVVVPVVLSICIMLSCYCFRRHRAIICPVIPDPSTIFKEMMMNGNRELKTTGSLYTLVPERVEPLKISLVSESLHQNL